MIDEKEHLPSLGAEDFELPHNAWFDAETATITFGIDKITLSFTVDEFLVFVNEMEDISTVLQQMLVKEKEECPTCGTHLEYIMVTPPADSDFN